MRLSTQSTLILLAGLISVPGFAQKPDLEGTWKLDLAKSFMGMEHPPSQYQLTKIIARSNRKLSITDVAQHVSMMNIPLPDSKTTMELTEDGKHHEVQLPPMFPGMPPMNVEVTAVWQGGTLEIQQRAIGAGSRGKQRMFLSDDGTQLVILVEQHSTFADSEQRLVFEREARR